MTNLSWQVYQPFNVGLDDIFNRLDAMSGHNTNYPPYNLIKHDNANYEIEIALAGFKANEIEVTTERNSLKVIGKKVDEDTREYLVKGIAGRKFSRQFVLSDTVVVRDANLADGILSIQLENVVPEEQKPRKIEIK